MLKESVNGCWDMLQQEGATQLAKVIFSIKATVSHHGKGKCQILI